MCLESSRVYPDAVGIDIYIYIIRWFVVIYDVYIVGVYRPIVRTVFVIRILYII